jgi:hypothetical protein
MVLTKSFLKKRGYCCNNGCKHCPYGNAKKSTLTEKDLWIGDKFILRSSNRLGTYEGKSKDGKLRIKVEGKILLTNIANLKKYEESDVQEICWNDEPIEKINIKKNLGYPKSIDLHIEVLSPDLLHAQPARILEYQIQSFKRYIEGAKSAKVSRVTIIHGKGAGVLMREIHQLLNADKSIKLKSMANGDGATEVWLQ